MCRRVLPSRTKLADCLVLVLVLVLVVGIETSRELFRHVCRWYVGQVEEIAL